MRGVIFCARGNKVHIFSAASLFLTSKAETLVFLPNQRSDSTVAGAPVRRHPAVTVTVVLERIHMHTYCFCLFLSFALPLLPLPPRPLLCFRLPPSSSCRSEQMKSGCTRRVCRRLALSTIWTPEMSFQHGSRVKGHLAVDVDCGV